MKWPEGAVGRLAACRVATSALERRERTQAEFFIGDQRVDRERRGPWESGARWASSVALRARGKTATPAIHPVEPTLRER